GGTGPPPGAGSWGGRRAPGRPARRPRADRGPGRARPSCAPATRPDGRPPAAGSRHAGAGPGCRARPRPPPADRQAAQGRPAWRQQYGNRAAAALRTIARRRRNVDYSITMSMTDPGEVATVSSIHFVDALLADADRDQRAEPGPSDDEALDAYSRGGPRAAARGNGPGAH